MRVGSGEEEARVPGREPFRVARMPSGGGGGVCGGAQSVAGMVRWGGARGLMVGAKKTDQGRGKRATLRLLAPAELAQLQGDGRVRAAYQDSVQGPPTVAAAGGKVGAVGDLHCGNGGKPPTRGGLAGPSGFKRTRSEGGGPTAAQAASLGAE